VVKTRPSMWVPGPETVRNLETYLLGYRQARADLGVPEFGAAHGDLLEEFAQWLKTTLGSKKNLSWPGYIEEVDPGAGNVHTFFRLFAEYLAERGMRFPERKDARWPAEDQTRFGPGRNAKPDNLG
jgi:hypothetical protein